MPIGTKISRPGENRFVVVEPVSGEFGVHVVVDGQVMLQIAPKDLSEAAARRIADALERDAGLVMAWDLDAYFKADDTA
ncbi:hypothetical protein Q8W71_09545 [Methylobacterium sp. NEAU 140]|uniref:hypothetical protein n=1 Tax=Methylobacterium sp. NEAU 140 TaxID=3064945 RepID=UPI002736C3CE|nr:hypothetical protein [Methylobacterium sp. NEAU 140]MDP4022865.1 hypothetical protein [Methylobacterium sp. NEAU 140]